MQSEVLLSYFATEFRSRGHHEVGLMRVGIAVLRRLLRTSLRFVVLDFPDQIDSGPMLL
jgi:hypothetical protein